MGPFDGAEGGNSALDPASSRGKDCRDGQGLPMGGRGGVVVVAEGRVGGFAVASARV